MLLTYLFKVSRSEGSNDYNKLRYTSHLAHSGKENNKVSQNIAIEKQQMAKDVNFSRLAARPY